MEQLEVDELHISLMAAHGWTKEQIVERWGYDPDWVAQLVSVEDGAGLMQAFAPHAGTRDDQTVQDMVENNRSRGVIGFNPDGLKDSSSKVTGFTSEEINDIVPPEHAWDNQWVSDGCNGTKTNTYKEMCQARTIDYDRLDEDINNRLATIKFNVDQLTVRYKTNSINDEDAGMFSKLESAICRLRNDIVRKMYRDGMRQVDIAKVVLLTPSRVNQILKGL